MPLDVGLIGAGNVSGAHLPAYRDRDELALAAVCDADEERARDVADEFDVDYWTDYGAFVAEAPVEAVDVTLPHALHAPVARAALEADLHVHVEKPFGVSMAECEALVALAEERDRRLMVGQMQRFAPEHRAVKRLVDEGALGPVRHARADGLQNLRDYAPPGHWLYDGSVAGGGGVISVLVHKLDLLRYFLGDVERVTAHARTADDAFSDAEDYCTGTLVFESGAMADFYSTYSAAGLPYGEAYWLFGDDAVVHALPAEGEYGTTPRICYGEDGAGEAFEPVSPADLPTTDPFVNELLHFADCVAGSREPLTSGRDNLGTLATVLAIYESADRGGESVAVDDLYGRGHGAGGGGS